MRRYVVMAVLLASSTIPAQAGWLGSEGPKLPKAISFVKGSNGTGHGAPQVARQNTKLASPGWGAHWTTRAPEPVRPLRLSLR